MPERRRLILTGAVVGLALTAPLTALLYLGMQAASLPMVAFDLFEGLTRIDLFRGLIAKSVDVMVGIVSSVPGASTAQLAKAFEQLSAVGLFLILGIIAGIVYALMYKQLGRTAGITFGVIAGVFALAIEIIFKPGVMSSLIMIVIWFAVLFLAWGYALGWTLDRLLAPAAPEPATNAPRRVFLMQFGGGVIVLTLASWGIGSLLGRRTTPSLSEPIALAPTATGQLSTEEAASAATEQAGTFAVVPGTHAEITPNDQFYRVDVNLAVPEVSENTWNLAVEGLVNKPFSLSYKDITGMPATKQYATLECISNPVGGDLISNTLWTGVKLGDVLKLAGLKDGVIEIKFKIEAASQPFDGYWELGGWAKDTPIKSTSIIDTIAVDQAQNGEVPIGGIAFAGARGISKVELAVDGGVWQEAQLKKPLSPLTWVLWRFNWKATKGHHEIRVRTTDGQGQLQIEATAPLAPNGASGYVSETININ